MQIFATATRTSHDAAVLQHQECGVPKPSLLFEAPPQPKARLQLEGPMPNF